MVIIGLCLTLVTVSGADPDSLTLRPGLTLDLRHHCGGDLDCWVNLVIMTGPHLLTLLGDGGAACPSNGKPLLLPTSLSHSVPGLSLAEHPALAGLSQVLQGIPMFCLSTSGILTSLINEQWPI